MDRIKALLREWASWHHYRETGGYPHQSPFATERVQNSNRSTDTYADIRMPDDLRTLESHIEGLPPGARRIIALEYLDRRPQKLKAADLKMPRQMFSARLLWIHEQLDFLMYGEVANH